MIRSLRQDIFTSCSSLGTNETLGETIKDKSGTVVAMIVTEAEAVGKFVGDCISTPTIQAGTYSACCATCCLLSLFSDWSPCSLPFRRFLSPPLVQRRINVQVRERVRTLRHAGDLIVDDLQGGGSASSPQGEIGKTFETIYGVRLRVFKLKFGLKFLVSGLQSMGVFVLLFAGGIMVLNGKTEIGIVVAFISGLDRVVDPWRELIAFVRSTSAAKVQFDLVESTLGRKL
jgi:hypothetical protein